MYISAAVLVAITAAGAPRDRRGRRRSRPSDTLSSFLRSGFSTSGRHGYSRGGGGRGERRSSCSGGNVDRRDRTRGAGPLTRARPQRILVKMGRRKHLLSPQRFLWFPCTYEGQAHSDRKRTGSEAEKSYASAALTFRARVRTPTRTEITATGGGVKSRGGCSDALCWEGERPRDRGIYAPPAVARPGGGAAIQSRTPASA